jgi:hypothetical protein
MTSTHPIGGSRPPTPANDSFPREVAQHVVPLARVGEYRQLPARDGGDASRTMLEFWRHGPIDVKPGETLTLDQRKNTFAAIGFNRLASSAISHTFDARAWAQDIRQMLRGEGGLHLSTTIQLDDLASTRLQKEPKNGTAEERALQRFDALDKNGDGKLTQRELFNVFDDPSLKANQKLTVLGEWQLMLDVIHNAVRPDEKGYVRRDEVPWLFDGTLLFRAAASREARAVLDARQPPEPSALLLGAAYASAMSAAERVSVKDELTTTLRLDPSESAYFDALAHAGAGELVDAKILAPLKEQLERVTGRPVEGLSRTASGFEVRFAAAAASDDFGKMGPARTAAPPELPGTADAHRSFGARQPADDAMWDLR